LPLVVVTLVFRRLAKTVKELTDVLRCHITSPSQESETLEPTS
jgi:hypothetical protein